MVRKSTWNRQFKHLSWRVDLKAASKNAPDLNEPVAFFELSTGKQAVCSAFGKNPLAIVKCRYLPYLSLIAL